MTDSVESNGGQAEAPTETHSLSAGDGATAVSQPGAGVVVDEHPELLVGAAFVGGLLLATILKRFAD